MKIEKKSKVKTEISMASMPDIVFMLLFFFMVSTVLKTYNGLNVELPEAERIKKLEGRSHISYLWIDREGNMSWNDVPCGPDKTLYQLAYSKRLSDNQLVVSLKYDRRVVMGTIALAHEQLRKAGALAINFATRSKVR
jgi:biopolymer transport protein ExbD